MATRPYRQQTGNQALVREINLSAIMNGLHRHAPVSRSALAEMTGLNKTTVSSLVQELINYQFIREVGLDSVGAGRPAMLLEFNPNAGCIISAEIETGFILVVCANFTTEITWRSKKLTQPTDNHETVLEYLIELLQQAVAFAQAAKIPVLGVAVGVPGLVDRNTGALIFGPNLGWQDVPLAEILRRHVDAPIFVDNNANMAALGEFYFGAAQHYNDVLYVSVGGGVGGGIIHGGQLLTGAAGFAGELGHMTVMPEGELCNCGNRGCWETLVSQRAIFRQARQALAGGRASRLANAANPLTMTDIQAAVQAGDALALEILQRVGGYLGIGLASLVNILNPELVVLGGIAGLGEVVLPALKDELNRRALRWNVTAAEVVLAQHGDDACVVGGMAVIYQSVLTQPSLATTTD